ncbi:MAG TPA: DsrE/DsrF/DrsH-like family protein [Solirubrobacteraceae bacterium]|jgi:predicted peroxiredoxin|nr:DsrE/DsrF/DrsH-like family protein [Solirubrobacteraceae bacterium]
MSDDGDSSVLYVMTHGLESPERCATPFFLAASAAAMDADVSIYFTMNGPQLLKKGVAEQIGPKGDQGQRLKFFIDQALDCGVKLLVCQPSLDLNDLAYEDLIDGIRMIGGAAFNDMAMDADAVISF